MNRQVKILILIAVLYGMSYGIYEYALPLYLEAAGISYRAMGWIYLVGAAVQFVLTLYVTSLADVFGRQRVYAGGIICGLVAHLLTPLAPLQWLQATLKALREVAQSVQANVQGVLVFEHARSRFLEFFSRARGGEYACHAVGTIVAIGVVAAGNGRYEPTFVAASVLLAAAVLLAVFHVQEPPGVELVRQGPGLWGLCRLDLHPKLYLLALSMFLFNLGLMISHSQYLLLFWKHKFGSSDATLGLIAILHRLSLGLPMIFAMGVVRRPRKIIYVCAVAAEGVAIAGSSLITDFGWAVGIWMCHDVVGASLWIPVQQHLILKYARPQTRATDVARVCALGAVGGIVAPLLAGVLAEYAGPLPALFSGAHDLPYFTSGVLVIASALPLLFL